MDQGDRFRMHDHAKSPNDPKPKTLIRKTPRADELLSQLLDAADEFLNAGRLERKSAESELLRVTDRIKRRLGRVSDWKR